MAARDGSVPRADAIRTLNDEFRRTLNGGQVVITRGLAELGGPFVQRALGEVRRFDRFNDDNDPHREHDFGSLQVGDHRLFFKIDYYDADLAMGSDDPADPEVTKRVMTIMLAEEY